MTTFHSIAHFAQNESGHFYHYHQCCQRAVADSIQKSYVYVPLDTDISELPEGWKKWFHPFYNKKNRKKFWKDCVRLFRQPADGPRIFFLEFFGRRDFFLIAMAALLFAKRNDTFWILYRDDLTTRRKKDLKTIRFFSKLLAKKFGSHFTPLTDSMLLANFYQTWFQQKVKVLPIPHTEYSEIKSVIDKERLICTWPGAPRTEKGAKEIAGLVKIQDPMAAHVELDVSGATALPLIKNEIELHLRKALLSEREYYDALSRSDIVLLPYDPKKYQWRTSGPFVEAVLAGKIPLVKEGSWLAHELARFDLCELIVDWENPMFFSDLFQLIKKSDLIDKLKSMQKSYGEIHTERNFQKSFQDLLQPVHKGSPSSSSLSFSS